MNRQIKFRGKCTISGDWVYGDFIHGVGNKSGNYYILPRKTNLAYVKHCDPLDGVKVQPESVGQFTGLYENAYDEKERNKPIYGGDAIEFIDGKILAVEWNEDTCQWQYSDGSPLNSGDRYATYKKIVGNIYENPEILNP